MKNHTLKLLIALTILASFRQAVAQGTAFTYQGQLNANGAPADGSYDLTFSLYTNSSGGTATVGPITNLATEVSNGLFTATIDFGPDVFTGASLWLQIAARTNGSGAFTTLAPRQEITATPYALYATNAGNAATATSATSAATATNALGFSGPLAGDVTGAQSATVVSKVGGQTAANVASGVIAANAATSANTASTIVKRDSSGNFAAGTVTANLVGNAAVASNVLSGINITNAFLTNAIITNSAFGGNGGGLTNLNASQLTSGVIPLARLPASVVTAGETGVTLSGTFSGNGGGLTSVNAALASNVVSGISISNAYITNAIITNSTFAGNGGGLTNLNASQLSGNATLTNLTLNGALILPNVVSGGQDVIYSSYGVLQPIFYADYYGNSFSGFDAGNLESESLGGYNNTGVGAYTLANIQNGFQNTAIGVQALAGVETGYNNTANGFRALMFSAGSNNTASGSQALYRNVEGNNNTAMGFNALGQLGLNNGEGGSSNIALGYLAGFAFNANESSNIDIGHPGVAGENNIIRIGSNQTAAYIAGVINGNGGGLTNLNASALAVGANRNFFAGGAGNSSSSGLGDDTAIGSLALAGLTDGDMDSAYGTFALAGNTSGSFNTASGGQALQYNQTGSFNAAFGYGALDAALNGNNNTAMGADALGQLGLEALFYGQAALTGGSNNVALGTAAGYNYTGNESSNIDIGNSGTLGENYTIHIGDPAVHTNTFIAGVINGNGGGLTNLSASRLSSGTIPLAQLPSAVITNNETSAVTLEGTLNLPSSVTINAGASLFMYSDSSGDFFAGPGAGNASTTGQDNTGLGYEALKSITSGTNNTALGGYALRFNTVGLNNTALGIYTLQSNISGSSNTVVGSYALATATEFENNNTAIGYQALGFLGFDFGGPSTGSGDIAIGSLAGVNYKESESGNIVIGNPGVLGENNTTRIGAGQTAAYIAGVINGNGNGLTNLNAANLTGGPLPASVLPAEVALTDGSPTFTTSVTIKTGNPTGASLTVVGNQTGNFANPIVLFENTNTSSANAPALRVVNNGGTNGYGALCVSANVAPTSNNGLIASFGNADSFVVLITNDGTIYMKGAALTSDRNVKENFTSVDRTKVLAKVIALPVTEWNYKGDAADKKHIGPVAQDFQAAFGLNGDDDKHISVVDEGGVALAAIQGLNQKLEEQKTENAELRREVAELKEMVQKLADRR